MRQFRAFNIPAGGRWPEGAGGAGGGGWELPPFNWIRIHHRSPTNTAGLVVSIDGSPISSETLDLAWDIWLPGESRVRNISGPDRHLERWPDALYLLNLDPVNRALGVIEVADHPIVDIGFKLSASSGGVSTVDVTDRAARLLGAVSIGAGSAATQNTGQITVGVAATLIIAANANRRSVTIKNASTGPIFLGNAGVTTANGHQLDAGGALTYSSFTGAIYAIVTAGTATVTYLEESA